MHTRPRILFLVPRYHTNMVGWVESLVSQNIDVRIIASRSEFSENHRQLKPLILSTFEGKILRLLPFPRKIITKLISPKMSKICDEVEKIKADRIVVRFELDLTSIKYLFAARMQGKPVFVYTQWPVIRTPILKKLIVFSFVYLLKMQTFSPVYERGQSGLDFNEDEIASRNRFDLDMKKKQTGRHLINWIPFTLSENFTSKNIRLVENANQPVFQFVTIGKFVERKNLLMIADVFCKNQTFLRSDAELIIIGECTTVEHRVVLQELNQILVRWCVGNKIKIFINLNHDEVQYILRRSQVFLLQSTNEPASISILEAMGNANVLILNPASGTANYAGDCYGSLASSTQIELHRCIDKVLSDEALVTRMQERSERIFHEYFSISIVGKRLYGFLFRNFNANPRW